LVALALAYVWMPLVGRGVILPMPHALVWLLVPPLFISRRQSGWVIGIGLALSFVGAVAVLAWLTEMGRQVLGGKQPPCAALDCWDRSANW
jgi:hypothetical protein